MSVKLGHFELLEQIGKGGMAAVFRAYDPSLNRKVAIKLLDEELARQDPQFVENFIHEAQSAAAINHPNIVQIYFVGEENGIYYIAMELLEGRSLDEMIKDQGPLSESSVLQIGTQVADALHAAYANHMIHGDIKPQNIFITDNGSAKLLDFGLAKMANIEVVTETDGSVWGSAYYISPERVGHKAEDFRSDIYSLGATLFHALVGHPPFDADTPEELAQKRLNENAPSLRKINPEISAKTEQIIARMLNKSTFLRYLDYNSLLEDLRAPGSTIGNKNTTTSQNAQKHSNTAELAAQLMANTANIARLVNTGKFPAGTQGAPQQNKNILPVILACSSAVLLLAGGAFLLLHNKGASSSPATSSQIETTGEAPASADQVSVPFRYEDASAKEVMLAGSFNNWHPEPMNNDGGIWTTRANLTFGQSYEYQFVVDGRSIPDPKRTRSKPHGMGGEASVFTVSIRVYPKE